MSQVVFSMCFGALAGWFIAVLSTENKNKMALLTHVLLGVTGALIGVLIFRQYMKAIMAGGELYALLLSLVCSMAIIFLGRRFTKS